MSMTNEQIQALKEKAECICGILENIAGYEPGDIDGDDVELRFETEDGFDTGCTVSIVEQCQSAADIIRSLLAERDADKALIAELEESKANLAILYDANLCDMLPGPQYMDPPDGGQVEPIEQVARMVADYRQQIAEQAKSIAKLERALDLARNSNSVLAIRSELESRTLTVKLPRDITHVTNKYFEDGRDAVIEAIESQLAAAGITLDVGE